MFDTHCHLNFPEFDPDRNRAIERAQSTGITGIINPGSSLKSSRTAIELTAKYPQIFAAVGLHPHEASSLNPKDIHLIIKKLSESIDKSKKVIAVGETGLDYYQVDRNLDKTVLKEDEVIKEVKRIKETQIKLFQAHLELAHNKKLPVIIHCRDAYMEILDLLKEQKVTGVIHCFSGNLKEAQEFLKMGFYLSFTGVITFVKDDDELIKIVKETPLEKILLETDAPYLTPEPNRGKRNEPAYVKFIAEKIADVKGISLEEVVKITDQNTKKLFNL
jgi:TatD DNase family protein